MIQVHIFASGSSGNAALLEFGTTRIMVDAGISARRISKGLTHVGVGIDQINAVLLTHEHSDHIKGIEVLARRYQVPVFTRRRTWEALPCADSIPSHCCHEVNRFITIGSVDIEAFNIPHDAADPIGFSFQYKNRKCVYMTDIGQITNTVINQLSLADVAVLESNHDRRMLANGPYPGFLKKRISGGRGHLSNDHAARILSQARIKTGLQVFLAHLSKQNNHPEIAEQTIRDYLTTQGCDVGREIILHRTFPEDYVGCRA